MYIVRGINTIGYLVGCRIQNGTGSLSCSISSQVKISLSVPVYPDVYPLPSVERHSMLLFLLFQLPRIEPSHSCLQKWSRHNLWYICWFSCPILTKDEKESFVCLFNLYIIYKSNGSYSLYGFKSFVFVHSGSQPIPIFLQLSTRRMHQHLLSLIVNWNPERSAQIFIIPGQPPQQSPSSTPRLSITNAIAGALTVHVEENMSPLRWPLIERDDKLRNTFHHYPRTLMSEDDTVAVVVM